MLAESCCYVETDLGSRASVVEIAKLGANGSGLGPIAMLSFDAMRDVGLATDCSSPHAQVASTSRVRSGVGMRDFDYLPKTMTREPLSNPTSLYQDAQRQYI